MILYIPFSQSLALATNPIAGETHIEDTLNSLGLGFDKYSTQNDQELAKLCEGRRPAVVIENPYQRAVSIYLRFCKAAHSPNHMHHDASAAILKDLKKETKGITFSQYLSYLRKNPDNSWATLYRAQQELPVPAFRIRTQHFRDDLANFFESIGYSDGIEPLAKMKKSVLTSNEQTVSPEFDFATLRSHNFNRMKKKHLHSFKAFLTERNCALIERVYKHDPSFEPNRRAYPTIPPSNAHATRPISFVTVHFSNEYYHNLRISDCVHAPINELIIIDNRGNLFFDNLSQAINAGIDQARHDLIAVVHEDVLLPQGWQVAFETAIKDLEKHDPNWGLLSSAGWTQDGESASHVSDPGGYTNSLDGRNYVEVDRVDEQLMIIRKSTGLRLDPNSPSIHKLGEDLVRHLKDMGLRSYTIDAPTIHKYANEYGKPITTQRDSSKIKERNQPRYTADWDSSQEYFNHKREAHSTTTHTTDKQCPNETLPVELCARGLILIGRGGSGTRLLSRLAEDLGVFLGNNLNESGDSMDMVPAIYRAVLDANLTRAQWQRDLILPRLCQAVTQLTRQCPAGNHWGFKVPESILVAPELATILPNAHFLHMIRDPLTTCLRRSHMTARFDNCIGRLCIQLAYIHNKAPLEQSLTDPPEVRMAYTTIHQIESIRGFAAKELGNRYTEIKLEDMLSCPDQVTESISAWLGVNVIHKNLITEVDATRGAIPTSNYSDELVNQVKTILMPLRIELGYLK